MCSMKIAIPAISDEGLSAPACDHFGSAPFFIIYETKTRSHEIVKNMDHDHIHGACNPIGLLKGSNIDSVLCRGMGARAVSLLSHEGITVYRSDLSTVGEMVSEWETGERSIFTSDDFCSRHGCR
jgi:predicted Fe-Mo cluster-binding NifX family protein